MAPGRSIFELVDERVVVGITGFPLDVHGGGRRTVAIAVAVAVGPTVDFGIMGADGADLRGHVGRDVGEGDLLDDGAGLFIARECEAILHEPRGARSLPSAGAEGVSGFCRA